MMHLRMHDQISRIMKQKIFTGKVSGREYLRGTLMNGCLALKGADMKALAQGKYSPCWGPGVQKCVLGNLHQGKAEPQGRYFVGRKCDLCGLDKKEMFI